MKLEKEEYFSIFLDYENISSQIYFLLLKLKLLDNLVYRENSTKKIFYSYNKVMIIKFFILKDAKQLFIKLKTKNYYIKNIRKIIIKKIENIQILYSDFLINNNINFYKKFIKYENKLREKIIKVMSIKYGYDWWFNNVNKKISTICVKRSNIDNNHFHYIFYADFLDVKDIIKNNWNDLGFILKNDKSNLNKLILINKKRNKTFHGRFDFI